MDLYGWLTRGRDGGRAEPDPAVERLGDALSRRLNRHREDNRDRGRNVYAVTDHAAGDADAVVELYQAVAHSDAEPEPFAEIAIGRDPGAVTSVRTYPGTYDPTAADLGAVLDDIDAALEESPLAYDRASAGLEQRDTF